MITNCKTLKLQPGVTKLRIQSHILLPNRVTRSRLSQQPKHSVRDMYLVTAATPTSVTAQKILHPVSSNPTKLMSKSYVTHPKHTRVLHSPSTVTLPNVREPALPPLSSTVRKPWSPTPDAFWDTDSDDDDFEDDPEPDQEDDPEPEPQPPLGNIVNLQAEIDANIHEFEQNVTQPVSHLESFQ